MKKLLKAVGIFAIFASILGFGFVGCENGDDEEEKGSGGGGGGSAPSSSAGIAGTISTAKKGTESIKIGNTSYDTLQAAFDACANAGDYTITLAPGSYEGVASYSGSGNVLVKGTGTAARGQDVIIWDKNNGNIKKNKEQRSIIFYNGNGSLSFEGVTLLNVVKRSDAAGADTQAETLLTKGSGNVAAYKCTFLSHQDTIQTVAKAWFYDCYVEGDVDFIWMEAGSKAALYEKCTIVSIGDDGKDDAYIAAPKSDVSTSVYKGLVVYKSTLKANAKNTILCRNPWGNGGPSKGMYNQVAYIDTTLDSTGTGKITGLNQSGGNAFYKDGVAENIIGWKLDNATKTSLGLNIADKNIVSDAVKTVEYNGRKSILNRVYNIDSDKYKKDSDANWDIDALVTKYGWTVDADTSVDKLADEKDINSKTYDFTVSGVTPEGAEVQGGWTYKNEAYGLQAANVGDYVKIPVTGDSVIGLQGYEAAGGTFNVTTDDGTEVITGLSAKTTKGSISSFFIYKGGATNLKLEVASKDVYLAKVLVRDWDGETAKAEEVSITGEEELALGETVTLSANVVTTYNGSTAVTWSIDSDTTGGATVVDGVVTPGTKAGEIVVKAASALTPVIFSTKKLVVLATASPLKTSVFDFKTNDASVTYWKDKDCTSSGGSQINSATGYIKGSSPKVIAYVDATEGKLTTTTGGDPNRAQFNKGTKIRVPVSAGSKLTVVARSNSNVYQYISVGGKVMDNHMIVCTASAAGYIEIAASNASDAKNAYLFGIKVTDVNAGDGVAIAGETGFDTAVTVTNFDSSSANQDVTQM